MSKGISTSLGKNEFFTLNLIIEKEAYRINGLPFDRTATNEEMLHLTKDVLQIFQEIEHKITNQARLHLSLEDKLLLTPEECQNYLIKLARCGQDAYKQFFFNQDAQEKFSELRSYPENMKFAPTIFSNYLLFPWEVIYEGDYKKGESEMFWGFHYPISRYLPVNHTPKRQFLLSLDMLFCLHHTLSYAHKQEQPEIEKVLIKNNGKLYLLEFSRKIGKLENGEELLDHFYQNQYNVLHFACHCRPCRQYEDEVDALIISFINEKNNNQQDGMGQVWAAHEQFGIYYLKNDTWRPYRILGEVKVSCLTLDSTGKLWAGTASGIYAINTPDRKPAIELPPAGFPPRVMSIVDENDIWLCNAQGVYNYKNASWMRTSDSVQPDVLTLARQGENLWLGTFRGLVRIDLSTNKLHKIDTTYPGEVTALAPHTQGVWAACGGQVGLATETGWTPLTEKRFNAPITSLLAGRDDQVWIGTHDGLLRGENKQILLHLTDNPPDVIGLASREKSPPTFSSLVQALSVQQLADRSILWIGTALGLFRYDLLTESWRRYGQLASQDIRAIITSQDQETVWVASWSSGLHGLKQQNELQTAPNISEPILTLTAGSDRYWAIGLDGLYQYKDSAWVQVISNKKLPVRGWLQAIAQAVTDHVWLGTSAGLLLYKTDAKPLTPITGNLGSADVRSLLAINQDGSELLFVGTNQGLYVGNLDKWEHVSKLENRQITALVCDDQILWVGTDRGLFCLRCQDNSWQVVNEFNIHNSGLGENRVIAIAISAGDSGEARLWVGTACGLSCYSY